MDLNVFPVINSTLSPEHLAVWVAKQYGLTNVSCRLLKTNMNDSYLVATKETEYVLRVYNHNYRTFQQVAEEVTLLNILKEKVCVSYPVANSHDEFINELSAPEGLRYAVLFSYAIGKKIRYTSIDENFHIGQEVGRLHLHTQGKTIARTDNSADAMINWAHQQLSKYIPAEMEEMAFIKASAGTMSAAFNSVSLTKGIVHLDLWYDNMAIQENGTVILFDFDNCGNGPLVLDLGYYCMQLFYIEADKAEYERKKDAFIEGYRSVISISNEELALIPQAGYTIWVYYLGLQAQRFDYFANLFLSENYIRMMVARVKGWLEYNNALKIGR